MPSSRDLRRRIKSVKTTRQITKAMELVSSAKMRRASEATVTSRPYVQRLQEVLADLLKKPVEGLTHPLIADRAITNVLVVAISSDRGLAGSYNGNLNKAALELLREKTESGQTVSFITIGKRIEQTLLRAQATILQSYPHTPNHPTSADIQPISDYVSESFLNGTFDQIIVLYTDFRSLLVQDVSSLELLPLRGKQFTTVADTDVRTFLYEPHPLTVLDTLLPRLMEAQLYQCVQEALASEHASRRMAMKSASDNASDMIDDLTLTYNGVRQANITRELAEITSGAAAIEN